MSDQPKVNQGFGGVEISVTHPTTEIMLPQERAAREDKWDRKMREMEEKRSDDTFAVGVMIMALMFSITALAAWGVVSVLLMVLP